MIVGKSNDGNTYRVRFSHDVREHMEAEAAHAPRFITKSDGEESMHYCINELYVQKTEMMVVEDVREADAEESDGETNNRQHPPPVFFQHYEQASKWIVGAKVKARCTVRGNLSDVRNLLYNDNDKAVKPELLNAVGFLCGSYEPRYWFWYVVLSIFTTLLSNNTVPGSRECVDLFRKFSMNAAILLIRPDTSTQFAATTFFLANMGNFVLSLSTLHG